MRQSEGGSMDVHKVVRTMIFIDGNNLFHSSRYIGLPKGSKDRENRILFPQLPSVFMSEVNKLIPERTLSFEGVHYVASMPVNYHPKDEQSAESQMGFYNRLKNLPYFQVYLQEIDFRGHVMRREQGEDGEFRPREKKVDMELGALMLQHCYRNDFDLAILVAGDSDYAPVLRRIIEEGKFMALFGIRNSCSSEFAAYNPLLTTWPVFWIDDLPEIYYREERDPVRGGR